MNLIQILGYSVQILGQKTCRIAYHNKLPRSELLAIASNSDLGN